jgi:hypothetical protein
MDNKDISGTSLTDRSGNGNTGTITGATKVIGKLGQALSFSGSLSNDKVSINHNVILNPYPMTVSFWLKTADTGYRMLVNKYLDSSSNGYSIHIQGGTIYAWYFKDGSNSVYGSGYGMSGGAVADGNWHYVVFKVDLNGGTFYIDGSQTNNMAWTGSPGAPTTTQPLCISSYDTSNSCDGGASYVPKGFIDDVRIYNRVLSTTEIRQLYNMGVATKTNTSPTKSLNTGLASYLTFDNNKISGTSALDSSGSGNAGTITSATKTIGKIGQGLRFDGSSSFVTIPNASTYLNFSNGAYSFWYKSSITSLPGYPRLVSYTSNGDVIECAFLNQVTLRCRHASDWLTDFNLDTTVPNVLSDRNWHHVTFSWNINGGSRTMAVEFDGVETSNNSAIISASIVGNTYNAIDVGRAGGGSQNFTGLIDDVRVYNRPLSTAEAKQLYNMGAPAKVNSSPTKSLNTGLVGYWTFDGKDLTDKVYDRSPVGTNHGYYYNSATSSAKTIGKLGQALKFNGVNNVVVTSNTTLTNNFSAITVSAWIRPTLTGSDNYQRITDKLNVCAFHVVSGGILGGYFQTTGAGGGTFDIYQGEFGQTVSANVWQHVVFVWDSATGKANIYKNGVAGIQQNVGGTNLTNDVSTSFRIGDRNDSNRSFSGSIDDVRVYNRALSATEIRQLYNQGR